MIEAVKQLIPSKIEPCFIENRDWRKQNGVSLLTAANQVRSPFLLTMSDHLFDRSIVDLLVRDAVLDQLNLAIDRKLDSIFDVDDAMKVQTGGPNFRSVKI
jgi:choline kinase